MAVNEVVLPGDIVSELKLEEMNEAFVIGPGLRVQSNRVLVVKSGVLRKKPNTTPGFYYVDCFHQKRYIPARAEEVLGTVANKAGDIFKVDIGSSDPAALSYLAFEGATKKNRPDVQVGDLVFSKLLVASRDMEPELVCVDSYGKEGKLRPVPSGGFVFSCSLRLIRKILKPDCPLFETLGKELCFEVAVGMNGKVWVKASSIRGTIAICNAILASEHKSREEIIGICKKVVKMLFYK